MSVDWEIEYEEVFKELEAAKEVIAYYANPRNWAQLNYDDGQCSGPVYEETGKQDRRFLGMAPVSDLPHDDDCECDECDEVQEKMKTLHIQLALAHGIEIEDTPIPFPSGPACCAAPLYHKNLQCYECDARVCPETHRSATNG